MGATYQLVIERLGKDHYRLAYKHDGKKFPPVTGGEERVLDFMNALLDSEGGKRALSGDPHYLGVKDAKRKAFERHRLSLVDKLK